MASTGDDTSATSEGEVDRSDEAIEVFTQLTSFVEAVSATLYERAAIDRWSPSALRSLLARFACSLALVMRGTRGRLHQASTPLADLRAWMASRSFTAREVFAELLVSTEELDQLEQVGQPRLRAIVIRHFDDFAWENVSPRAMHYSICRMLAAAIDLDGAEQRVRVAKNDPAPPIDTAAEYVVDATFGAALREQASSGERKAWLVLDPRCRSGGVLLAVLRTLRRELASRTQATSLVDGALRAFVRDQLRGADADATAVMLTRLGLWLETGEALSSADLRRAVVLDGRAEFGERPRGAKVFLFSDTTGVTASDALTPLLRASREGDCVGALVDVALASGPEGDPARAEWDREVVTQRPLIEPRLGSSIERPRTLALIAARRAQASDEPSGPWPHHAYCTTELERRLLLALSVEPTVLSIAESTQASAIPIDPAHAWPKVCVDAFESPLDAWLVASATSADPMLFSVHARTWNAFALLALLHSSIIWWQRSMLASARGAKTHAMRDVLELAVPSYCDPDALAAAGAKLASAQTEQEVRAAVAAIDFAAGFGQGLDEASKQMLVEWRRALPTPEPSLDGGVVDLPAAVPDATSSESPRKSSPSLPPRPPTSTHPSPRGAHSDGAPKARHTKSNRPLARGNESMLHNRSDDGRAAELPGPKLVVVLPESEAEREAWAILCAAGTDGLPLNALVRRAREHGEDEIREAISRLINDGWIEVVGEEPAPPIPAPRINDEVRLRPLAR